MEPTHTTSTLTYALLGIAVVALLAVTGTYYFYMHQPMHTPSTETSQNPDTAPAQPSFTDLGGKIYLTLAPAGTKNADLYVYDIENDSLTRLSEDELTKYMNRFSDDGSQMAFMGAVFDPEAPLRPERAGRDTFPFRGTLQLFNQVIETDQVDQLTNDSVNERHFAGKRLPRWSPDGKTIAFTAQLLEGGQYSQVNPDDPESWQVYALDVETNEISSLYVGSYSFWSPDGTKLLHLANDGIYLYDLNDQSITQVRGMLSGDAKTQMKLDLSRDKKTLAWSNPGVGKVLLFDIVSWDPFLMEPIHTIETGESVSIWPTFSPDGKYMALQEIDTQNGDRVTSENFTNMRLSVVDLETFEIKTLTSLDEYNWDVSFVTDWSE